MGPSLARRAAPLLAVLGVAALAAAEPAGRSVLHLRDGGFVPGSLGGSGEPSLVRWQSPFFARPLDFPLGGVVAVHATVPGELPKPTGEYCFEMTDDDVLYGDLRALSDAGVEFEAAGVGRVRVAREHLRRFYRWQGAERVYTGPSGLAGWKATGGDGAWREEGGQLVTDRSGASVYADLGVPDTALIEAELSWTGKPDFVLALGVDEREATAARAFHFESWEDELVAVGESARDADVVAVQLLGAGVDRVRVRALLDQKKRSLTVLSPGGKPLAALTLSDPRPQVFSGIRLTNTRGNLRLESLRIARWTGRPPAEVRDDQPRLHKADGSIVYGRVTAYDPAAKRFTVVDGKTETRLGRDEVADVYLSPSPAAQKPPAAERPVRVTGLDGSRVSGTLTGVGDGHLTVIRPGVGEPLRLPLAGVRSLVVLGPKAAPAAAAVAGRLGTLEAEGLRLKGRLVTGDAKPSPDASCLAWQPDLAGSASPLRKGPTGRIVYRAPPPPAPPMVGGAGAGMGAAVRVARGGGVPVPAEVPMPPVLTGRRSLHLRSGDVIPCDVSHITEQGVTFTSPVSAATFVPHDKIKCVELTAVAGTPSLNDAKRDRLLTLPRAQKGSPPTHLIWSTNGDVLRGRVMAMDDRKLVVEVRLETREVPRDRVAQITWLHADELGDAAPKPAAPAPATPRADRVQAVRADGNRVTFVAEKASHRLVSGTSDVLGECSVALDAVDLLLLGDAIERSAAELAAHRWKLRPAEEPKFLNGPPGGDGETAGTESALVGKPAVPFKLDLLGGKEFDISAHKGKVVVLDFWATWCGPCMQTLPLVEGVAGEFADKGVELIAVNMEETPDQIKATLERHKLKMPVALDRDGVVAGKYGVTAIPQTVVIDREGKVARLFVGGGKATADALRKALEELCGGK
jgi:thiol-disulfide isomerase/thioredoxin